MVELYTKNTLIPATDHEMIGRVAREKRKLVDLTLTEVGVAMGITAAYLSLLEKGQRRWNKELIESFNQAIEKLVQL